ncbi:hypothetical protein EVAR_62561_1 [Eumeta japonica]|uniref:Uncharacterized protein n=1 Tax=Eumeta variegata TaxID=151549 RepID=A0A4C1YT36_EUMVA|nr:hypothetical protein EVAR_62561_1 [Eumeta japonica]
MFKSNSIDHKIRQFVAVSAEDGVTLAVMGVGSCECRHSDELAASPDDSLGGCRCSWTFATSEDPLLRRRPLGYGYRLRVSNEGRNGLMERGGADGGRYDIAPISCQVAIQGIKKRRPRLASAITLYGYCAAEDPWRSRESEFNSSRLPPPGILSKCRKQERNPKSEAITMSLVKMIAVDMLPLSFVEGPGLLQFLHTVCPDYTVPSRTVIRDRLQGLYDASTLYGTANHIFIVKQILEQQDDDTENIILIKETLEEELKNRFLSNSDVTSCGLASYLDPRYKDLANEEETYRNKIKEKLMDMTKRINVNEPDSSKINERDLDFLFDPVRSLSGNLQRMASLEGQTAIEKEMLKYDREPTIPKADNPLLWWNSKGINIQSWQISPENFWAFLFKHTFRKGFSTAGNYDCIETSSASARQTSAWMLAFKSQFVSRQSLPRPPPAPITVNSDLLHPRWQSPRPPPGERNSRNERYPRVSQPTLHTLDRT